MSKLWNALGVIGSTMRDTSHALRGEQSSYLNQYMDKIREKEELELEKNALAKAMEAFDEGPEAVGDLIKNNAGNKHILGAAVKVGSLYQAMEKQKPDYRTLASQAAQGQVPYDQLAQQFPDKLSQIKEQEQFFTRDTTPVEKSPDFREGKGLPAFFSKNIANLTPRTKRVIGNIKTRADLDELLDNEEDYTTEGVDVKAIREYFGER